MMARTLDRLLEEGDRQVDMDARPVAGLAVRIHRAPVPHGLQRIDRGRHDTAGRLAVDRRDHADAAGIGLYVRPVHALARDPLRSEEHTSELQSPMRISNAVFCLTTKN